MTNEISLSRMGRTNVDEPFYLAVGDEVGLFEAAYADKTPVLLKGPTGTGKTRFLEYMASRLSRGDNGGKVNLTTVSCQEDLTASDLLGRFILEKDGTRWVDGPLTHTVRNGGICYLDEVVEARKDVMVVVHSLTDHRRFLPIAKLDTVIEAHTSFLLVVSYNPGYQTSIKDLKHSTRQRFVAIDFSYPSVEIETEILKIEGGALSDTAARLSALASNLRNLNKDYLIEGPSTRLLVYASRLISRGVSPKRACISAIADIVTDDPISREAIVDVIAAYFGDSEG
ncbi:MAG: CbbQ/NirQ/NorQ/GpvN family protein [Actinomycetota bacterium]|nr:MAG: CbbQ/NirQ/NorQ/GpvN family protein [Actinomycetota bacterium]